ncbi:MAG TPA: regulatory protein RecX, partial [Nitrospiria bacterium]
TRLRQKDVSPEVIERVFTQLNDWGYLDDLQFARQWTRDRGRVRGWGPHRLRASLREKGVKPEWIDAAVGEWFSEIGEQEAAEDLLTRRFREHSGQSLGSAREKQRVFSYLYRRGYSNDVIYRAIRAVFPPDK